MDQLPAFGTEILPQAQPTFQTYEPLILAQAETIRSVPRQTYKYGAHERQQLDVYRTPKPSLKHGRQPVLLFIYGGGFIMGDKTLPGFEGLVHANMAAFFALKCGYSFVAIDYRLLFRHDAKFPSGGEDVSLAVEWLLTNAEFALGSEPIDLFTMGNSAGGVHLTTFLLHQNFAETRAKVLSGGNVQWKGAILLSVPFSFSQANADRAKVLNTYYEDYEIQCPLGLLKAARKSYDPKSPRVFVLNGELDTPSEIMVPRDLFVQEWLKIESKESKDALAVDMMPRHNHISPPFSLGTDIEEEEAWGFQVSSFCDNIRKFKSR